VTLRNKKQFKLLDEYLTRKVLPRLGRHKIEDRLFSRLLPPSHTPQKFFAQTSSPITHAAKVFCPNIGLHATSRCFPSTSKFENVSTSAAAKKPRLLPNQKIALLEISLKPVFLVRPPTYINFLRCVTIKVNE